MLYDPSFKLQSERLTLVNVRGWWDNFLRILIAFPSVRVHVGNDEVLLDDSVRFVERAVMENIDARLDVWEGMIHGFPGSVRQLAASDQALRSVGEFLNDRFTA